MNNDFSDMVNLSEQLYLRFIGAPKNIQKSALESLDKLAIETSDKDLSDFYQALSTVLRRYQK